MSHEQFEDAIPLYVVGALERSERQALEAHFLTGCPICRTALDGFRPAAAALPFALTRTPVPPALKATLMQAIAEPVQARATSLGYTGSVQDPESLAPMSAQTSRGLWAWFAHPGWAIAALLVVAVTAWYTQSLQTQIESEHVQRQRVEVAFQESAGKLTALQQQVTKQDQELASLREHIATHSGDVGTIKATLAGREAELEALRAQLTQRERETASLRTALAQRDEMLTFLRSPTVKVVSLAGLEKAKTAGAFLLFDPDSKKAFFYAFNMPALPSGKTYQLWAIVDKPVSAGTFLTDAGHKGRLVVRSAPEFKRITKFAVSLEPEGGNPQPTGDIYLMGQL